MELRRRKPVPVEPSDSARALSARARKSLQAFAKLFGYVRHFHPSDGAKETDWDEFAIAGVKRVEPAKTSEELAAVLRGLFADMAPGVRIWTVGQLSPAGPPVSSANEMVWWNHHGFGAGRSKGLYRSSLERAELAPGRMTAVREVLQGGVECIVPLQVPAIGSKTLPSSTGWKASEEWTRSGNARATRLASVIMVWNVMQHFYPYFDVVKTDWELILPLALDRAANDNDQREFANTLRMMAVALKDGHGSVRLIGEAPRYAPDALWEWVEGKLVVTEVGKAEGIRPGDVIVAIDDKPAAQALREAEEQSTGATSQLIRYRALRLAGTGARDSKIRLTIEPWGGEGQRRTVELRRDTPMGRQQERRPEKIVEIKPGIWYVDWGRISNEDFDAKLSSLSAAKGIVFDLRGYPSFKNPMKVLGHLLANGGTSAQWHVPMIVQPNRVGMTFERQGEWTINPQEPILRMKKVFLTDGRAISYAESCMGIVEHYKIGEIVGEATAGTNGNVNPLRLPGGYSFTWTGMKVLKHDGSQHHGVGIAPTIPVMRTRAGVASGVDEVLERGLKALE
jgi:C-terminal processing protease CtpA/Prc